jgi:hypothetical protein
MIRGMYTKPHVLLLSNKGYLTPIKYLVLLEGHKPKNEDTNSITSQTSPLTQRTTHNGTQLLIHPKLLTRRSARGY